MREYGYNEELVYRIDVRGLIYCLPGISVLEFTHLSMGMWKER